LLHMILNNHDPQDCVFRGDAESVALKGALRRFEEVAAAHDVVPQGTWMARTAHEVFALVDAPHAHAVEEALIAAGLPGLSRSRIVPIVAASEVLGAE
jgi:hypothetical protein